MAQKQLDEVNDVLLPVFAENRLEEYIFELTLAKTMKVCADEKTLIYTSLVKSGRVEMMQNLNVEQAENLDNFITYLRDTYGKTLPEQRQAFENVKQMDDEPIMDFFARVERLYFRSKGIEKPAGTFPGWMQEDVSHAFRSGLRNNEIRRLLMLNSATVQYADLAKTAKNYAAALKDINKVYSVNAVDNGISDERRHGQESEPRKSRRMRTPYRK